MQGRKPLKRLMSLLWYDLCHPAEAVCELECELEGLITKAGEAKLCQRVSIDLCNKGISKISQCSVYPLVGSSIYIPSSSESIASSQAFVARAASSGQYSIVIIG
jgi:hypothetical protein